MLKCFYMFFNKKVEIITDEKRIDEILNRGVEDVFVKDDLVSKLKSGKELRIKLGVDPTSPNIHLGRAVVIRKLRDFQKLGHKIIFLVGDFTALIGDASDKLAKRPMLTEDSIKENLKTYKEQVGKIIDLNNAEFRFNSEWLAKLTFKEVAELAESFSVSQMISRRNFKDRLDKGDEVSLREFLYPIMQGYDSVVLKSDIEIGGFDQLFNLKAGRIIQKHFNMEEQNVLTITMLEGTDGRKMSSSWGNIIAINDSPNDMYGKVMSVRDELMEKYFILCTDVSSDDISEIMKKISDGENPKDAKMKLAREIVSLYHGEKVAEKAENNWVETFSKRNTPEDVEVLIVESGRALIDVLAENKIVESRGEFRRLIEGGAVKKSNDEKITDPNIEAENETYKIGKRRFIKISLK